MKITLITSKNSVLLHISKLIWMRSWCWACHGGSWRVMPNSAACTPRLTGPVEQGHQFPHKLRSIISWCRYSL